MLQAGGNVTSSGKCNRSGKMQEGGENVTSSGKSNRQVWEM